MQQEPYYFKLITTVIYTPVLITPKLFKPIGYITQCKLPTRTTRCCPCITRMVTLEGSKKITYITDHATVRHLTYTQNVLALAARRSPYRMI